MTKHTIAVPDTVQLYYGGDIVGQITGIFFSDNTWFGVFQTNVKEFAQRVPDRVKSSASFAEIGTIESNVVQMTPPTR